MKIYLNTNEELRAERMDSPDEGFNKSDFLNYLSVFHITKSIESLSNNIEVVHDSKYQNWKGGIHSRQKQCWGNLWCSHDDIPIDFETAIDRIIDNKILEAIALVGVTNE